MRKIVKTTSIVSLVLLVAFSSVYIPLKVNNADIKQAKLEARMALNKLLLEISQKISLIADQSNGLLATVAGSTKSIKSSLNGQPLNIFSLEPMSYLKLQAPIFNLLPLFFGTSTKTPPNNNPLSHPPTQNLSQSLNQTSAPIISKKEVKPEDAIVNIFCSQKILVNGKVSNKRRTVTGSGVLINKDGTVLTNAHVGQFPLLSEKNSNIVCLARYGNPTKGSLSVRVSYISPEWVKEYGKYINTEGAPQTGKSDFALLKISLPRSDIKTEGSTSTLSPIVVQKVLPTQGETIYSVSYPADILGVKGVTAALPLQKEQLSLSKTYSLGVTPDDVIETSPSTSGQRGASGGAIVDQHGHLIGTITTIVNSSSPSKKIIRAMSIAHTDAELSKFSNTQLADVVNFGSSEVEKSFNSQYREYLTSLLNDYLK